MPLAVIMPKYEMAQETGTVGRWLLAEGAAVAKGDPLLEVETDKVTMEVESPAAGRLAGICAAPGDVVPIGQVIAYILKPGETLSTAQHATAQHDATTIGVQSARLRADEARPRAAAAAVTPVAARVAAAHGLDPAAVSGSGPQGRITRDDVEAHLAATPGSLPASSVQPAPPVQSAPPGADGARPRAAPAARRLARQLGIDLATLDGRGPQGRIQSADVQRAADQRAAAILTTTTNVQPAPPVRRTVPLTHVRRTIAERMTASVREIPQFTLNVDADMSRALALLDDLRGVHVGALTGGEPGDSSTPKVTLTALLVKACAAALLRHPNANASFAGDRIEEWEPINIGIAISSEQGLFVPVICDPHRLGLYAIAAALADLTARARGGRLRLADLQGGTFTLSNLGMQGIDSFTAIVNPPQAAILAAGRVAQKPSVAPDGSLTAAPLVTLSLTADHRVLDGAAAAALLKTIQALLEHPGLLLA
jgi:pyruvate dehydrogenase E2 component (dihydrolipoamide acetyltransferase)